MQINLKQLITFKMNLGFYYHVPVTLYKGVYYIESYFGVFLLELAEQCNHVYVFAHQKEEDIHTLIPLNTNSITVISLGKFPSFYERMLNPQKFISIIKKHTQNLDAFMVRAPTPLAPFIKFNIDKQIPVYYVLVGNYLNGLKSLKQPFIRKIGIYLFMYIYQWLQHKTIKDSTLFVNSIALQQENQHLAKQIHVIKTTTLLKTSFYPRIDTCQSQPFKILYTGRINFQKGLRELVQAAALLIHTNKLLCEIHIVGWQEKGTFNYEEGLQELANQLNIGSNLFFHGKKSAGTELNTFYREADIYVIPSYHEGFPRTIWEAMANSLPVIASNVGGIPFYIKDGKEAILVEPKNVESLHNALKTLIENTPLRTSLIKNAYLVAKEVTLEKQCKNLTQLIKNDIATNRNG